MEIINNSFFQFAPLQGKFFFPDYSCTFIVKGTFDMVHGQKAAVSEEQDYPTGDAYYPDDIDMAGSLFYESDFAYFKPKADLLLAGHCHPPKGGSAKGCRAVFQVGNNAKEVYVFGDRQWQSNAGFLTIQEPQVFQKKRLVFENSFGGPGFKKNPVGIGYEKTILTDGKEIWPLPCIQSPDSLIGSPKDRPDPVGFGPVGRMWQDRLEKSGTYDDKWMAERWPWFPEDFDWSYFNAAQPDMQVDGYLKGNERLFFENLHPDHAKYESKLPGIKIRCFINQEPAGETGKGDFREVKMNLDTLWADMDAEKLCLVWRGVVQVQAEDMAQIDHVFIMSTALTEPEKPLEDCHRLFSAALQAENQLWEEPPETPEMSAKMPGTADLAENDDPGQEIEEIETAPVTKPDSNFATQKEILKKQMQAATTAILGKLGIDTARLPEEARLSLLTEQDALFEKMTADASQKADVKNFSKRDISENFSKIGIDVNNLPALSDKAKSEQLRMIRELTQGQVDAIPPEFAPSMAIFGAVLTHIGIDPENLGPFIEEAKKQQASMGGQPEKIVAIEDEVPLERTETQRPQGPMTRETVVVKASKKNSFAGENLSGLDLSGLDLSEIDFTGVDFSGADLKKSNLSGSLCTGAVFKTADLKQADLTRTVLEKADMTEAVLDQACLKEAFATEADFTLASLNQTDLTDAVFEKVVMPQATLNAAKGLDTCFTAALLSNATFCESDFSGADFSGADLTHADFTETVLFEASIEGAKCRQTDFSRADLTCLRASEGTSLVKSCFHMAQGKESMWRGADLKQADFSHSIMPGADFSEACMEEADLTASDMKFARFMETDLSSAKMVHMNLFQGSLEKARLVNTDLSFSNLYGVEFLEADIKNLKVDHTNLKMTKLRQDI